LVTQKPIELILARNLMSSLSTPAFLVDDQGTLVFYNDAAGALLGRRFEEAGQMTPDEWGTTWGPLDDDGRPIPVEHLPLTIALRQSRPAHARFQIRSLEGTKHSIEAAALPILVTSGSQGAMVFFWPLDGEG
jgi:PAS domain-containing protein